MKYRSFIGLAVSILVLLGSWTNKANERPNVVIIFIDDMGYADPSSFGNPVVKTPNIDALAQQLWKMAYGRRSKFRCCSVSN